jgi:hypothetical protein
MNAFSFKPVVYSLRIFWALILAFSGQVLAVNPVSANSTFTIVDTLGAAAPSTQFQLPGAGGLPMYAPQQVGPMFVVTQPTVITEIGVFMTQCELNAGVMDCPSTEPIGVQIRPAVNGLPDLSRNLGTFVLTDKNPQVYSYVAVHPQLSLKPGTYFAIFVPLNGSSAGLLATASDPFTYQAGAVDLGFVLQPGDRTVSGRQSLAVRILGKHGQAHKPEDDDCKPPSGQSRDSNHSRSGKGPDHNPKGDHCSFDD